MPDAPIDPPIHAPEWPRAGFLVRALLFPVVLTVAIALANGAWRAVGLVDDLVLIFAVVGPFAVFWFWLTEIVGFEGGKDADAG